MKTQRLFLSVIFLGSLLIPGQVITAQESSKSEKENELKLQQAIEVQKKAMTDQRKALDHNLDSSRNFGNLNDWMRIYGRTRRAPGNGPEGNDDLFGFPQGANFGGFYGKGNDAERTAWDFSKQVKETTFTRDYSFDVEKTANNVVMSIIGDCKSGQIDVKIIMPNGKLFSDITIDESGNLNWRKSFVISEDGNKDKAGEWKFKIATEKATGYFKISLQTF